jgi:hypothetical protein
LTSRMEGKSAAEVMRGAGLEADDVIAALEYLLALPYVDKERGPSAACRWAAW